MFRSIVNVINACHDCGLGMDYVAAPVPTEAFYDHPVHTEPSSENRGQERSTCETAWRRHLSVRSANAVLMSYEGSGTYGEF